MRTIDLNCDMGESFGIWKLGRDAEVMPHISSASLACGAHAGDPSVMRGAVRLAKSHGVAVGAHPGYPDLQGFGRRRMAMPLHELENWIIYQLGALWAIARAEGVELSHVKPHGALYNDAASSEDVASAVVRAVRCFSGGLPVFCLPASLLEAAVRAEDLLPVPEGFVDRAYEPNGELTPRSVPGSVHTDPAVCAERALLLASGEVHCRDGSSLSLRVDTLCLHGDSQHAPEVAAAVRRALEAAGYVVAHPQR